LKSPKSVKVAKRLAGFVLNKYNMPVKFISLHAYYWNNKIYEEYMDWNFMSKKFIYNYQGENDYLVGNYL